MAAAPSGTQQPATWVPRTPPVMLPGEHHVVWDTSSALTNVYISGVTQHVQTELRLLGVI